MSTTQSNNKTNIFVQKEHIHNLFSLCYFSVLTLLIFIVLLLVILKGYVPVIIYLSIVFLFILIKLIWQFKLIASFKNLTNKITKENIPFYISKSWKRKREATVWIGLIALAFTTYTLLITVGLTNITHDKRLTIVTALFLSSFIFVILITMYINIQILDVNLKNSVSKINFDTIEWEQIIQEQRIFYKTAFTLFMHILFLLPLVLLVIPSYRKMLKKIIKK